MALQIFTDGTPPGGQHGTNICLHFFRPGNHLGEEPDRYRMAWLEWKAPYASVEAKLAPFGPSRSFTGQAIVGAGGSIRTSTPMLRAVGAAKRTIVVAQETVAAAKHAAAPPQEAKTNASGPPQGAVAVGQVVAGAGATVAAATETVAAARQVIAPTDDISRGIQQPDPVQFYIYPDLDFSIISKDIADRFHLEVQDIPSFHRRIPFYGVMPAIAGRPVSGKLIAKATIEIVPPTIRLWPRPVFKKAKVFDFHIPDASITDGQSIAVFGRNVIEYMLLLYQGRYARDVALNNTTSPRFYFGADAHAW